MGFFFREGNLYTNMQHYVLFLVLSALFDRHSGTCIQGCFCTHSPALINCIDRGLNELNFAAHASDPRVYHVSGMIPFVS